MRHTFTLVAAAFIAALFSVPSLSAQSVGYTANDVNPPYTGKFRPGINLSYVPPWENEQLGNLAAGNPALGIAGVGARSTRPGLADRVLDRFGYDLSLDEYAHFKTLGMEELTAIVGFPSSSHRSWETSYCSGDEKWNALFSGIYEPIWDDQTAAGYDGTPINEDNEFAKYMYTIVPMYTEYVRFWEIWNEPGLYTGTDSQVFWGQPDYPGSWWVNDPDPCDYSIHAPIEQFVRTLRIAYEVIKAVSPDDYVTVAGVGSQPFLDAILRNSDNPGGNDLYYSAIGTGEAGSLSPDYPNLGGAYIDVLGFHAYPHFDGSTSFRPDNFFERHSDGAADGVITRRLGGYQQVLYKYGYDGITYPKKQHIATEINVPRQIFSGDYFGGNLEQINFIQKVLVSLKINKVHQMHVYSITDGETEADADFEFDLMGLYKKLDGITPYNQEVNDEGIAYKTAADIIYPTEYDLAQSNALQAGPGIRAHAFAKPDGSYVYALWAETQIDLSEEASATFTFPTSLGIDSVTRYEWDYSRSGTSTKVAAAGNSFELDATPIYLETRISGSGTANQAPTVVLTSSATEAAEPFSVNVKFSEVVTGLTAGDFAVSNGTASGLSGSGAQYFFTVTPAQVRGDIGISLPANRVVDASNLGNFTSNALTVRNATQDNPGGGPSTAPDSADLSLVLNTSAETVEVLEQITWTLALSNNGPDAANDVVVEFELPDSLSFVTGSGTQGGYNAGTGRWSVGSIAAGTTAQFAVTASATTTAERTGFAQVLTSSVGDKDSNPGNGTCCVANEDDEAAYTINIGRTGGTTGGGEEEPDPLADLSIVIESFDETISRFGSFSARVTITNDGPQDATGVTAVVRIPSGVTLADALPPSGTQFSSTSWSVNRLNTGESKTLILDLTASDPTASATLVTEVMASEVEDPDSTPGNGAAGEDDFAMLSFTGSAPTTVADLELSMRADRTIFRKDDLITFTTTLRNTGDAAATGVVVHAGIPVGVTYVSHQASTGNFRLYFDRWSVANLSPGAAATLSVTVRAVRSDPAVLGFAQVVASASRDADSRPNNRPCCTPIEDDEATTSVRPAVVRGPSERLPYDLVFVLTDNDDDERATETTPGSSVRAKQVAPSFTFHRLEQVYGSDALNVNFSTSLSRTSGTIVDGLGRRIRTQVLAEGPGTFRTPLQTEGLTAGSYTLLIETPEGVEAVRLVVAK